MPVYIRTNGINILDIQEAACVCRALLVALYSYVSMLVCAVSSLDAEPAVVVAAAAQDTGGAQAMVEAHGIVLQRGAATAGRHHQLVHEATADHLHLLVSEATADHQHSQPTARSPPTQITRNPPSSNLLEMLGGLGVFL